MQEKLKKLLEEKVKILKPDECAIIYDDKRGLLVGVCNEKGKISFISKRVEEFQ